MTVKFATYNIQYGVGQDDQYNLDRIAKALKGQDIIALQEVTTNFPRCHMENQPEMLAKALNLYSAFATGFEYDVSHKDKTGTIINTRMSFGNMVLSRWPIIYSRAHTLPRVAPELPVDYQPHVDLPRVALETVIEIDGTAVRVISAHLSHLPGIQRTPQIDALKNLATSLPQEPALWQDHPHLHVWNGGQPAPAIPLSTLIFGDFNFEPDGDDYANMVGEQSGSGLVDAWNVSQMRSDDVLTCNQGEGHLTRLDYLFISEDMRTKIQSAKVDQTITASDHFPVFFEIEV
jgi:endonuclease/exonuclease/phosphatase family metal-dependent hydrolase